jgi:hypothetical protein
MLMIAQSNVLVTYEINLEKKDASPVEKTRQEKNVPVRVQEVSVVRVSD